MSSGQPDLSLYHSWPPDTSPWGVHLTKHHSDPQADDVSY